MAFLRRHLLGLEGLTREEILFLLDTAASFKEISEREIKKVPTLRGKTVIGAFFEPSTRTRVSFEIAAKRMSADFISLGGTGSSAAKGESLLDTARNLGAMRPDVLVLRHPSAGAAHLLAKYVDCAVINAGDGAHEHPTQALLDLVTIRERKERLDGLTVAIIGDILHSRVARSNLYALRALGAEVRLAGPRTLLPPECAAYAHTTTDLREAVHNADVIMLLRLQRERQVGHFIPSVEEYARYYCLSERHLAVAKPDVIVMHPGPLNRGIEISSEVADGPYSVILDQVSNGVAVRMAVLYLLGTGAREGEAKRSVQQITVLGRAERRATQ
ncbi:MAG: aspartate carbamoyltransferase catalytic subunit [Candidatus Binatia bacterium]|nr:aspartate carbamoyltransferase catalytic subunit [Candidatus Binatia bacterium]